MASGWGGRREGAGRKPVTLVELVLERRFDWWNRTHRALLMVEELPAELPGFSLEDVVRLRSLQRSYAPMQQGQKRSEASWLAQRFEDAVREGGGAL